MEEETPNSMYITADVLEDLLLKVPLKSLCRFKSVSKEWKSILESKRFVERHLSLAKASRKILLAAYHCNCGVSPSLLPESRFEGGEEFFSLHCDATRPSMNCDGLVCFPEVEWVDVLNPSTGQLWRFNSPSLLNPRPISTTFPTGSWSTYFPGYCAMGFGKDSVKGSYKVVRIFVAPNYCDILDVNTGEWRKLWKPRRFKVDVGRKSASVNGSIYWLRIRPHGSIYTILALDLHTEEFRDVQRPPLPKGIMSEAQIVNIGDRLAIAIPESHPVHQYVLNIWIMDAQDETWTNSHSISLASLGMVESRSFTPVTLSKHGNVVFYDDKMWLFKYYPHTDQLQILSKDICIISPYLQNLVLLQTQQVEFKTGITCIRRETEITDVVVGQSTSVDEILSEGIARSGYCGNVVKIAFLMKLCSIIGF
ncbi:PREDICTED: F-box/LRR-repeat protein At2g43260-like [Camelina sativa]|uniref:F-box/LRR-repeat protein At2g43260-like n=1 Tax=Camelina sativa TaxID=90675 RepID=A0ABM0YY45_CAMSA|nr:PREDICTED: F-box/LRR-repeat protein At2g43260-like [Camelina sativa]